MKYRNSLILILSLLTLGVSGCGDEGGQSLGNKAGRALTSAPAPGEQLVVTDWAPKETEQGVAFNPQPTGKSALWVMVTGVRENPGTMITFDGKPMEDMAITDKVVTGAAPLSFIETPGPKEIAIQEGGTGRRVVVGTFMVKPKTTH